MSQWIWKYGEYEIYHSLRCHTRRRHYGYTRPAMWRLPSPEPVVRFRKSVTGEGGEVRITANGDFFLTIQEKGSSEKIELDGKCDFYLPAGSWTITVLMQNERTFPCLYVSGAVESDESWIADDNTSDWGPVGTDSQFTDPLTTPETFPFRYEKLAYVKKEIVDGGILYDFGRESYARVKITGLPVASGMCSASPVAVRYGESREEALDARWAVIRFEDVPENGTLTYPPYALRYLWIGAESAEVFAEQEEPILPAAGTYACDREVINRVWETAAYTFRLNCREFILDGIKRDGWVWSADAYQSFFVNRYLYFDRDLERRTLIALAGKSPVKQHINTIVDYTFFWLISLYDYYRTYGDRLFLERIHPIAQEYIRFCLGRTDEDGFMRGRKGDWIFIDWAPMDKTGALCGEQILYAKAMESYHLICEVLGADDLGCGARAKELQNQIRSCFLDTEKGVYIDSFESGLRQVTRHSNLLAYLYLPCSDEEKQAIYEKVILNPEVPEITTPYFKFYENQVHCMEQRAGILENSIEEYYGGMLATGATSLYEAYDPKETGAEHYAMYGHPYEKSLCHAWSASPIYLLGRYRLGVKNTGIAYETFTVEPQAGDLETFAGSVPVPGGFVRVSYDRGAVTVTSDIPGGTLILDGKTYELKAGETLSVPERK